MDVSRFDDRWEQLNELFHDAQALPENEVEPFCRAACGDDQELYTFLCELLNVETVDDDILRSSIMQLAGEVASDKSLLGKRVGAYRFDALLGKGGMGEVYLASRVDGEFDRKVAIKVVQTRPNQDDFLRFFNTERQVMANLSHPYIPALQDAGQLEDGRPYFICDYIEGLPVDQYCEVHHLDVERRLSLFKKIVEALQYAHNNLVLHLDIKPENILIQQGDIPSLLDFGVARLMTDVENGVPAFSPQYASPEQIDGGILSAASDVYSLGVLMYQLLTNQPPFATSRHTALTSIVERRQQFRENLRLPDAMIGVHPDLQAIIRRATSLSSQNRYVSAGSLMRDITRYEEHYPVSAQTQTVSYRVGKYLRRNSVAIGAGVIVFAVSAGVFTHELNLRKQAQGALVNIKSTPDTIALQANGQLNQLLSELLVQSTVQTDTTSFYAGEASTLLMQLRARDQELADQPALKMELYMTLGEAYLKQDLVPQAQLLLEPVASQIALTPSESDDAVAASLHVRLMHAFFKTGQPALSAQMATRILHSRSSTADQRNEALAALTDVLHHYQEQGRLDDARAMLELILVETAQQLSAYHPTYAQQLGLLAKLQEQVGEGQAAEENYRKALNILTKAQSSPQYQSLPEAEISAGQLVQNYADLLRQTGRENEANSLESRYLKNVP